MPDYRTSQLPDVTPFTTLIASIDVLSARCGAVMKRRLPDAYRTRRLSIPVWIETTEASSDGSVSKIFTDPFPVTGWNLLTPLFFISDTFNDAPQTSVFVVVPGTQPT